jgi:hypothetical protein
MSIELIDRATATGQAVLDRLPEGEGMGRARWLLTLPGGQQYLSQYRNDLEGRTPSRSWDGVALTERAVEAWGDHAPTGKVVADPTATFTYKRNYCRIVG